MSAAQGGLTDEHRAHIVAALPPGVEMTQEAWADLEEIVTGYHVFATRRATYPVKEERDRWERIGNAAKKLEAELHELHKLHYDETLWTDPGPILLDRALDPMWLEQALAALWEVRERVETRAAFHELWAAFRGRQNPDREFLYWGIMRVWTNRLGGELCYSRSSERPVPLHGPLVRFLVACVKPILGDKTPTGLDGVIDREREARAKIADMERQRREHGGMGF